MSRYCQDCGNTVCVCLRSNPLDSIYSKILARNKEAIIKDGYSTRETHIICPHCGERMSYDFYENTPQFSETYETVECEKCEKEFKLSWDYSFSTKI